jgi:hypothetical protein
VRGDLEGRVLDESADRTEVGPPKLATTLITTSFESARGGVFMTATVRM